MSDLCFYIIVNIFWVSKIVFTIFAIHKVVTQGIEIKKVTFSGKLLMYSGLLCYAICSILFQMDWIGHYQLIIRYAPVFSNLGTIIFCLMVLLQPHPPLRSEHESFEYREANSDCIGESSTDSIRSRTNATTTGPCPKPQWAKG